MHTFATLFALQLALVSGALGAPTANVPRAACADVMVIFARGTTEAPPIGTVAGPPLQSALTSALRSSGKTLSFAGVSYPADVPGFLAGGDPQGSKTMAADLTNAANSCPKAALVTVGYSQGGQLVHNSAKMLSSTVSSRIKAAVIFGDPDNGTAVAGVSAANTKIICHTGDNICAHGDLILPPHLYVVSPSELMRMGLTALFRTYGQDASSAAAFIVSKV
ncbi:unnamed protein product [Mycena citricolor]|uniref:cutinase n=1 Tax=Mycena citricolor TaxID=2018698 RepID=A0AAD2K2H9_9AGAR|nr:unnamed protein product [Mycena citricolor]